MRIHYTYVELYVGSMYVGLMYVVPHVQWNLYNEGTFGTAVNGPVQWNLYNEDTFGTTIKNLA